MIQVLGTQFPEAKLYVPDLFEDDRGFFKETYSEAKYAAAGLHDRFVQDSVSWSTAGVLRGMHYDMRMSKLVQCLRGRIFDVIADMRPDSATYLRWQGFLLSEESHRQLYIPAGFAHGFLALADEVLVSYKQSAAHDPAHEMGAGWDDPALGIDWPLNVPPRLSAKDRQWPKIG